MRAWEGSATMRLPHLSEISSSCLAIVAVFGFAAQADAEQPASDKGKVAGSQFLTAERQAQLTPEMVLTKLKERNKDFVKGNLTIRNTSQRIRKAADGQHPGAVVLSCVDSRVPVEDVFHSGIGDMFVARVAGNTSNPEILGSLEFACKVSGARVIVVMGHDNCGAVRSAIDNVKLGNITATLKPIRSAMKHITAFDGEKTSQNPKFVEAVCRENVRNVIREIRKNSPILKQMENDKEILIVGAEYYLGSGNVEFFASN